MKPDRVGLDMEEYKKAPGELFLEIGMLITEGRVPERSVKGRMEGPHCPTMSTEARHTCTKSSNQCLQAQQLQQQMKMLWKNQVPMCIEVLLSPLCKHNQGELLLTEDAVIASDDEYLLLERWMVQFVPKRVSDRSDRLVSAPSLLQALRSYLHFSQLSSWLSSTNGDLPLAVTYRVFASGDCGPSHSFRDDSELQTFPSTAASQFSARISLFRIPRMMDLPTLTCLAETALVTGYTEAVSCGMETAMCHAKAVTSLSCRTGATQAATTPDTGARQKPPLPRSMRKKSPKTEDKVRRPNIPGSLISLKSPVSQERNPISHPSMQDRNCFPFKPDPVNRLLCRSDCGKAYCPDCLDDCVDGPLFDDEISEYLTFPEYPASRACLKPLKFHKKDTEATEHDQTRAKCYKKMNSPKVLLTSTGSAGQQNYYNKKCLDFDSPLLTDDTWSSRTLTQRLTNLANPLTSQEIETYLVSISNRNIRQEGSPHLDNIPSTKCDFYIGETWDENRIRAKGKKEPGTAPSLSKDANYLSKHATANVKSIEDLKSHDKNINDIPVNITKSVIDLDEVTNVLANIQDLTLAEDSDCDNLSTKGLKCENPSDSENGSSQNGACVSNATDHQNSSVNDVNDCKTEAHDLSPNDCDNGVNTAKAEHLPYEDISTDKIDPKVKNESTNIFQTTDYSDSTSRNYVQEDVKPVSKVQTAPGFLRSLRSLDMDDEVFADGEERDYTLPKPHTGLPKKGMLCRNLLKKDFLHCIEQDETLPKSSQGLPTAEDLEDFKRTLKKSTSMLFNAHTGLPMQSSPAPVKRKSSSGRFDYDSSLTNVRAIKNAFSCSKLAMQDNCDMEDDSNPKILSTSAPASTNCLLGNFEESILNGRIDPVGVVDGFTVEIGASGSFCPKHVTLPVTSYFFSLSDDNAPSPYLGHINLEPLGKKGYHIPKKGTVQVTLFNPNKTVVKMFVVMYDLSDMPAVSQTFLRQRTLYMPVAGGDSDEPSYLRYLIHLRFASTRSSKIYLHTDIRLIFARDKFEFDSRVANYELRSFTEGPGNPKFSPKR